MLLHSTSSTHIFDYSNALNSYLCCSVSAEEMKDDIIVETDSALTELSLPIGNQIPTLPAMINVNMSPLQKI